MFSRVIVFFLLSTSLASAKYYKCFYSQNDVIDYSISIALFLEDNYISVMDNIYHLNADFVEKGNDSKGEFSIYKKEAQDFLYQAKLYISTADKSPTKLVLVRKNLIDNKIFPETVYICKNPDLMKDQTADIPIIIDRGISKSDISE